MEKSELKIGFICSFVMGLLVHLYMLTNKLPLADDVAFSISKSSGIGITSGRWVLEYYKLSGWNVPMIRGALALLFGSIAVVLLCNLWNIKRTEFKILFALLFWSYPFVASVFTQMYMADVYFLGVMLGVFGAYLFVKKDNILTFCISVICFAFITGIYQSLIQFAIMTYLCSFVVLGLDKRESPLLCVKKAFLMCCSLMGGIALYEIILKIELARKNAVLTEYQGISSMNSFSFSGIIEGAIKAYNNYFSALFKRGAYGFNNKYMCIINCIYILLILVGVVFFAVKKRHTFVNGILFIGALILFPLAINFIYVMAPNAYIYSLQKVQYMFLPLFSLAVINKVLEQFSDIRNKLIIRVTECILIISILAGSFIGFSNINNVYYKLQLNFYSTYAYYVELVSNLKNEPNYEPGKIITFIGDPVIEGEVLDTAIIDEIFGYGWTFTNKDIIGRSNYGMVFCKNYLGLNTEQLYGDSFEQLVNSEEFQQANVYPTEGFAITYNDYIAVKMR